MINDNYHDYGDNGVNEDIAIWIFLSKNNNDNNWTKEVVVYEAL